jgi:hypothetical protein
MIRFDPRELTSSWSGEDPATGAQSRGTAARSARFWVGLGPDDPPATGAGTAAGSASNDPNAELLAEIKGLHAVVAPMREKLDKLEREAAYRRRIDGRERGTGEPDGGTPPAGDARTAGAPMDYAPKIQDPAAREAYVQLVRENEARTKRDAEADAKAKTTRALDALRKAIKDSRAARPDTMFRELKGDVKIGLDGRVIFDDGETIRPIEDVVREKATNEDIYKPAPQTNGTGTPQGSAPPIATTGGVQVDPNATPQQKLAAAFGAGASAVVARK